MFTLPEIEECIDFAKNMGCTYIREIAITPRETDRPFMCHMNCSFSPKLGYYFAKDLNGALHAFKHSVLDINGALFDVTPTLDNRTYNIFAFGTELVDEHLIYLENSVCIYNHKQRLKDMYYVYGLIDPRTNLPFYIGKGKGDRWKFHYKETSLNEGYNDRKKAKIKKLKSLGYDTPIVEFYAQNIEDEALAYNIERELILKYGRIGFEENGILVNLSEDSNPPNWKGKSYEFIYGTNADVQRIKRANLQKSRGGYFRGNKHSEESKTKISNRISGENNGKYSGHTKEDILNAANEFCKFFDFKISKKKWRWWAKKNDYPVNIFKSNFRFEKDFDLFSYMVNELNATLDNKVDGLLWFHNPETGKTFRCMQWEIDYGSKVVPENMIRGRGGDPFKRKVKLHKPNLAPTL